MSTLTDRYVWGVLSAVPDRQRADLEPEIKALVADAVEARAAAAPGDPAAAERAALTELGDPELLAARYTDRPLYLIGPAYYLDYRRLLTLLLTIVVPIVTLAVMIAGFIAGTGAAEVALSAVSTGVSVGVQLAFWVTLVFAIVERRSARAAGPIIPWTLDRLPSLPPSGRLGAGEAVVSVVASVIVIGIIAWQPPFSVDGGTVPFFDPALDPAWSLWFVGVAVLQIAFTVLAYAARRWTWPIAIVNAALGAAFAIPAVWLLQSGQLLNPEVTAEMERIGAEAALAPTVAVISVVIIGVVAWDAVDGFRRARRGSDGRQAPGR
jgi:hypothetical protein